MTNKCPICGEPKKNDKVKTCGKYNCMGYLAHETRKANLMSGKSKVGKLHRKKKGKKYVQKTLDMMLRQLDVLKEKTLFLKEKNLR